MTLFCSRHPVFAPGSSKVGSWVVWSLCIFWVQNLPQLHLHTVIFSPTQFLWVLLLKERCAQVQALQHGRKSPRSLTSVSSPAK